MNEELKLYELTEINAANTEPEDIGQIGIRKKKSLKSVFTDLLILLIFLAGGAIMAYPSFSNWYNQSHQSKAIMTYREQVAEYDVEAYHRALEDARAYNADLCQKENVFRLTDEARERYESLLNLQDNRMMGFIEIPKIKVSLPIYHSTEEAVLQVAVGHVEWSSLPVGGENTHVVLSGHRGLPSAKLFTNLDKLELGDEFYIYVLDQKLVYRVDQILTVLPEDTDALRIEEGQDYLTLVTCTPYGINTHRLLVRGVRVA